MSLREQLFWCDTEPSESLKVGFFSLTRHHFRILLTIDRYLVQIQTLLCFGASLVNTKNKVDPWCQFCPLKCVAHPQLKLPNSCCPGRQLNIINLHAQMVRAQIAVGSVDQKLAVCVELGDEFFVVSEDTQSILPGHVETVKNLVGWPSHRIILQSADIAWIASNQVIHHYARC